jgi:hypothetical protein
MFLRDENHTPQSLNASVQTGTVVLIQVLYNFWKPTVATQ